MLLKIYSIFQKRTCRTCRLLHITRQLRKNHYETLKLPRDCTAKQIRESFITLSKEHHPDLNRCRDAHAKFLKIQEAYNVLSKPQSRRDYDLCLANPYAQSQSGVHQKGHYQHHRHMYYGNPYTHTRYNPWDDPSFWANRSRAEDEWYKRKPYYGIQGVDRVSNATIALVCIFLAVIGVSLQVIAVRSSFTLKRDLMRERSMQYEKDLAELRRKADENGNEVQLALLKKRLMVDDDDD